VTISTPKPIAVEARTPLGHTTWFDTYGFSLRPFP
jgi:hypothetical protein